MVIEAPKSIKHFSEEFLSGLKNNKGDQLTDYIAGVVLGSRKRTLVSLGETVLTGQRHKTVVSKFFRRNTFKSGEILLQTSRKLIRSVLMKSGLPQDPWVLIIDGTCTRRGAFTKIANAIQYKEKRTSSRGVSTKAHTFIMGLLIAPVHGIRIPLRRSYYTKKYCRDKNRQFKTQNEIAAEMILEARRMLPPRVKLIVIADSFFDTKILFETVEAEKTIIIVPADSDRVCNVAYGTEKIHTRGKKKKGYRNFSLVKGDETYTAVQSRFSHPELKEKKRTIRFRLTGEVLDVPGAGDVSVAYSWKKRGKKESFKAILCSDSSWSPEKIAEYYMLRWQIEIYFRELKGELGLSDFSGQSFEAFERFVDLCLLAFLFLEWNRSSLIEVEKSRKEKGRLLRIRTHGMKQMMHKEAMLEAKEYLKEKLVA